MQSPCTVNSKIYCKNSIHAYNLSDLLCIIQLVHLVKLTVSGRSRTSWDGHDVRVPF